MFARLTTFIHQCIRVFMVTKKPSKEEFTIIVKVSSIGIAVIGILGFLITVAWQMLS